VPYSAPRTLAELRGRVKPEEGGGKERRRPGKYKKEKQGRR